MGLALGAATVAWMWQMAIVPPDRLPMFGVLACGTAVGIYVGMARSDWTLKKAATWATAPALLVVIALTGTSETVTGGSLRGACSLTLTVDGNQWSPSDTTGIRPLDIADDAAVTWRVGAEGDAKSAMPVGIRIGGWDVPIWNGTFPGDAETRTWIGDADVGRYIDELSVLSGITISGTYHVFAYLTDDSAPCAVNGYVSRRPHHPFDGPILTGLTLALVTLVGMLVAVAVRVHRPAHRDED